MWNCSFRLKRKRELILISQAPGCVNSLQLSNEAALILPQGNVFLGSDYQLRPFHESFVLTIKLTYKLSIHMAVYLDCACSPILKSNKNSVRLKGL